MRGEQTTSTVILITFTIYAAIYEAPNFFMKQRLGLGDAQYATSFWQSGQLQRKVKVIDSEVPGMRGDMVRSFDIDLWISCAYHLLCEVYSVFYLYGFFYLVLAAQVFLA